MTLYIRAQYAEYLSEYLEKLLNIIIKNDKTTFSCPVCKMEDRAQLYPNNANKVICYNPDCTFKKGDIFDLIKALKNPKFNDEDVAEYLKHKFKIVVKDDVDQLLKLYDKNKWCLFPLEPNSKNPQQGFMWTEKLYTDPVIWKDWIDRGYGLALRGGEVSNTVEIDIDSDETYNKKINKDTNITVKDLVGEDTLIQQTKRGHHWIFEYEEWMKDINHINFRNKGYDMEIRCNNAYIAIAPTSAEGEIRKWNNKKIQKMPNELKDFILGLIDKDTKNVEEEIQDSINKNELGLTNGLVGLDGQCNDVFIKLGGIFRKKMNVDQTKYALHYVNQLLEHPMDKKTMRGMGYQLSKYQTYDKKELSEEVIKRLETIKEATAYQIASSLKKEVKDIEDVLKYLEDENRVLALSGRKFKMLENVKWTSDKANRGVPIDFQMPYFHDYARFNVGGIIIIGSPTGKGKSHITGNFIKQLWKQKRVTHLIDTEADGGIGRITHHLKIPDEAYLVPKKPVNHPTDIELKDNAITIVDWLKMKENDFTKTDATFEHFSNQLKIHKGFVIIFTQTRPSDNKFFAPDQIGNYGALVVKYLWGNDGTDGCNTHFLTTKIRDSKSGNQYLTIPTIFNQDTKILEIRK